MNNFPTFTAHTQLSPEYPLQANLQNSQSSSQPNQTSRTPNRNPPPQTEFLDVGGAAVGGSLGGTASGGGYEAMRKRRQGKIEREEVTELFYQLIRYVNGKVYEIGGLAQPTPQPQKPPSQPPPPQKSKPKAASCSTKPRKQDQQKPAIFQKSPQEGHLPLPLPLPLPRKQSLKQEKLLQQKLEKMEKMRRKQEIFDHYDRLMGYTVHWGEMGDEADPMAQEGHSGVAVQTAGHMKSESKGKIFSVVQQVSIMFDPIQENVKQSVTCELSNTMRD